MRWLALLLVLSGGLAAQSFSLGASLPVFSLTQDSERLTWEPGLSVELYGFTAQLYSDGRYNFGRMWCLNCTAQASDHSLPIYMGVAAFFNNAEFIFGAEAPPMRYLFFFNLNWNSRWPGVENILNQPLAGIRFQFVLFGQGSKAKPAPPEREFSF